MSNDSPLKSAKKGRRFFAPWELAFDKMMTPIEEFIHRQTTGGIFLMVFTVIALLLANSPLAANYQHFIHLPISIGMGDLLIEKTLLHWVNDGLMALFFFVVGLELKREILVGELADPKAAALPIVAAIGGMLIPAGLFALYTGSGDVLDGWGIPMATDIAFAIGALVMLGSKVPRSLIAFLIALAIADDLGAVLVIALFYTADINTTALLISVIALGIMVSFNRFGVREPLPYFLIGVILWFAMLKSGVHATIAGILTAFCIPALPKYDPQRFVANMKELLGNFGEHYKADSSILTNQHMRAVAQSMHNGVAHVQAPLQRLEHGFHLPVALLIIPFFALVNAGIPLDANSMGSAIAHPVTVGVMLGLLLGKVTGISLACYIALKMGVGHLPHGCNFKHIIGVGWLAGIGFTMSIFIAELAYSNTMEYVQFAKTGILLASLCSGIIGILWLRYYAYSDTPDQDPAH